MCCTVDSPSKWRTRKVSEIIVTYQTPCGVMKEVNIKVNGLLISFNMFNGNVITCDKNESNHLSWKVQNLTPKRDIKSNATRSLLLALSMLFEPSSQGRANVGAPNGSKPYILKYFLELIILLYINLHMKVFKNI